MSDLRREPKLVFEELRALKFFLWLFYFLIFAYDFFYYFLYPSYTKQAVGLPEGGLGFVLHILLLLLLPIALYLVKHEKAHVIKYVFIFTFLSLDLINNILIFLGSDKEFLSGHLAEIFFILFSPIFVNKRFFWTVSISFFAKYILFGFIFQTFNVLFPLMLILFISAVSLVLLSRFQSYLNTINQINDSLRQKEKLAVIGQMATSIGHEIRNPLSSLKGFTQLQMEKHPEDKEYYPIMLNEIDRINSIVTDLLVLGKPKTQTSFRQIDVKGILEYVVSVTKQMTTKHEVNIYITDNRKMFKEIYCDENQIKQVFMNLIKNAIEAMETGGDINITIETEGENVAVVIMDQGCGILEEDKGNLGNPFFTTKKHGTGLGLLVSNKILEEHGGKMEIDSKAGEGTKVTVILSRNF